MNFMVLVIGLLVSISKFQVVNCDIWNDLEEVDTRKYKYFNDESEEQHGSKRSAFSGFKVYSVSAETSDQFNALMNLFEDQVNLDFWKPPSSDDESAEIMVPHSRDLDFRDFLQNLSFNYSVMIDDLENLVAKQYANFLGIREREMTWSEYHYPETIELWLKGLPLVARRGVQVNHSTVGYSVENRALHMVKISSGGKPKRAVFIDGGIHAREWITPAVSTYIINELVTRPEKYSRLLDKYDFYIMPLLNPDGYAHSCSYNRLWRKSRNSNDMFFGFIGCRGVDLNRNFGYSWGGKGSGRQPCSLIYGGSEEFSEPETAAIRDFIRSEENADIDWIAYFSLHSFGQKWLTPWGHKSSLPDDYKELERVAKAGMTALKSVHGTRYSFGTTSNMLYAASGSSMDWFKGDVGVKYTYTLELRDYGLFGFLLPAYQIIPTAEETWVGIQGSLLAIPE